MDFRHGGAMLECDHKKLRGRDEPDVLDTGRTCLQTIHLSMQEAYANDKTI